MENAVRPDHCIVKTTENQQGDFIMELTLQAAQNALSEASASNPGPWTDHSRYVAMACQNIAARCDNLSADYAYLLGLLHDIGRYAGVTSERHLLDGYRYCMERGWEKAAQICISHAFMIQDIEAPSGHSMSARQITSS